MTCNLRKPRLTVRLAWWCRPSGARRTHEFRDDDRREGGQADRGAGTAQTLARRAWRIVAPLAVVALTAGMVGAKLALPS